MKVFIESRNSAAPKNFRVEIDVPADFAHPTANFEREVRFADGYRFCQTDQRYFPDGILEADRVLIQRIHFKVPPDEASRGLRLQKPFRIRVKADGMPTQVFEEPLARVLQYPNI